MPSGTGSASSADRSAASPQRILFSKRGEFPMKYNGDSSAGKGGVVLKRILKTMLERYKELFYAEADTMKGFMALLMKPRNTGIPWTQEEIRRLKLTLRHLAHYVPFLVVFLLPFGTLLLPAMAEVLDRRRTARRG
jgi:hypothetical protein